MREAVVAVVRRGERFLVIQRGPGASHSGYWAPLSGRIEPGETSEQALVREIHEEVGLVARPLARVWECPTDDDQYLLHWWTAETDDGELALDPAEVAAARWVTAEEFLRLSPTFAGDREFVSRVLPTLST